MFEQANVVIGLFPHRVASASSGQWGQKSAKVLPFQGQKSNGEADFERLLDRAIQADVPKHLKASRNGKPVAPRWNGWSA